MAESSQELVDIDPDFEPLSRPRSCTWPLPRPEFNEPDSSNTSSPASSIKQESGNGVDYISNQSLLEESEDVTDEKTIVLCRDFLENCCHPLTQQHQRLLQQHQLSPQLPRQQQQVPPLSPTNGSNSIVVPFQKKSASSRRNAWGNMSYADLISKAIESSPDKRLTLSQIYDWMVQSVPYFKDKGDSNSSAGWKVTLLQTM